MALILFLFKVNNLNLSKSSTEINDDNEDQPISDTPTTQLIVNENTILLCAKVTFRNINLWSNNVPIRNGSASFIARGQKAKKFNFNLGTALIPDDIVRIEFYSITSKKKRKKLIGIFEVVLESLIHSKYIDLPEENLFDVHNQLLPSTVQLKLYYTPPDIHKQRNPLPSLPGETELVDWNSMFDDEGRHGGHRSRHTASKSDKL